MIDINLCTPYDPFFKKEDITYVNAKYIPCYKNIKEAIVAYEEVKKKCKPLDWDACINSNVPFINYVLGKISDEIFWFNQKKNCQI